MSKESLRRIGAIGFAALVGALIVGHGLVGNVEAAGPLPAQPTNKEILQQINNLSQQISALSQQVGGLATDTRRKYFLSTATTTGAIAADFCGEGFHMASLPEIFNTSVLKYDTSRGVVLEPGDQGPPTELVSIGWIRTNAGKRNTTSFSEVTDCNRYTTTEGTGTVAGLPSTIQDPGPAIGTSPWGAGTSDCDLETQVWCVED